MPIAGINQPELIQVDTWLRLRKYDGKHEFALAWYQDEELVWLVDGVREAYTQEKLARMYTYLNTHGELYWIEAKADGLWRPIGDVTFWQEDMPIVIGPPQYRSRGIGRRVVAALVERARSLGFTEFHVGEIYRWNTSSRALFTSMGFVPYEETEQGHRYKIHLAKNEV